MIEIDLERLERMTVREMESMGFTDFYMAGYDDHFVITYSGPIGARVNLCHGAGGWGIAKPHSQSPTSDLYCIKLPPHSPLSGFHSTYFARHLSKMSEAWKDVCFVNIGDEAIKN